MPRKCEPRIGDSWAGVTGPCRGRAAVVGPGKGPGPREHRWSRGTEGAHSGRISYVRNVQTPSWSGTWCRQADRKRGGIPGGKGWPGSERRPPKGSGKPGQQSVLLQGGAVDNRPDTGHGCRARKGADASQVSL